MIMTIDEIAAQMCRVFAPDHLPPNLQDIQYPTGWNSESQRNLWRECIAECNLILNPEQASRVAAIFMRAIEGSRV